MPAECLEETLRLLGRVAQERYPAPLGARTVLQGKPRYLQHFASSDILSEGCTQQAESSG